MNQIDTYLEKNNLPTTKEYIKNVITERGVDFHSIIIEAYYLTLGEAKEKNPRYISRNWMPETMYGNMVGRFRDYYPDLMKFDSVGRPYLKLANDIRVYFKKLDERYRPNNIETDFVNDLWSQNLMLSGTKIHVLYVGYILENEDWGVLKGVFGAYPSDFYKKKIEFPLNMIEFTKQIKMPITKEEQTEEIIITPKKSQEKEANK